jgi:acetyl-CoA acetyltransferase
MDRGGLYGPHPIRRFNGGLFREVHAIALSAVQLGQLLAAAECDWSDVEPSIFGTLLERIGVLVGYDDPRGRRWQMRG